MNWGVYRSNDGVVEKIATAQSAKSAIEIWRALEEAGYNMNRIWIEEEA